MKCPHLITCSVAACKATGKPYVPSLFELDEYCRTHSHSRCPFYLRDITGGAEFMDVRSSVHAG
ncbi:MAG: hypothetical protein ACYC69_17720 [Thermodesulfovibrionales bacterium]